MSKKIGVLTSSRADYGIYKPFLALLNQYSKFKITIIIFGSHLLEGMESSLKEIQSDKFGELLYVGNFKKTNTQQEVAKLYGETVIKFSEFWNKNSFDLIIAIGDRFEMAASVQASIPFKKKVAHFHGGEITQGAIDNIYRDQISLVSKIHFTSNVKHSDRLKNLLQNKKKIFNVGALSLSKLPINNTKKWENFRNKYSIPKTKFILFTFHPETSEIEKNKKNIFFLRKVIQNLQKDYHILITGINSDQEYLQYFNLFEKFKEKYPEKITLIENLGRENYFLAMHNCSFLLGNSSSGIIESASIGKYNLIIGNRQKGRLKSSNTIEIDYSTKQLDDVLKKLSGLNFKYEGENKYYKHNTAELILSKIKLELA